MFDSVCQNKMYKFVKLSGKYTLFLYFIFEWMKVSNKHLEKVKKKVQRRRVLLFIVTGSHKNGAKLKLKTTKYKKTVDFTKSM